MVVMALARPSGTEQLLPGRVWTEEPSTCRSLDAAAQGAGSLCSI